MGRALKASTCLVAQLHQIIWEVTRLPPGSWHIEILDLHSISIQHVHYSLFDKSIHVAGVLSETSTYTRRLCWLCSSWVDLYASYWSFIVFAGHKCCSVAHQSVETWYCLCYCYQCLCRIGFLFVILVRACLCIVLYLITSKSLVESKVCSLHQWICKVDKKAMF